MNNIKVTFLLPKTKMNQSGQVVLLCRLTADKDRKDFSTGVSITPQMWDRKKRKVKGTSINAQNANQQLEDIKQRLNELIYNASKAKECLTPEILRYRFRNKTPTHTVLSLWDYYMAHMKIDKADGTLRTYTTRLKNIKTFLKDKLQVDDLPYIDVTYAMGNELYQYLRNKTNAKGENNKHNFSAKVVMFLRSAFDYGFKNGLIDKNVWANINYPQQTKKSLEYLSYEDLQNMATKDFGIPRIQQIADCFVFQASCGLAYIDFANLTPEQLKTNPLDGRIWIYTQRQKTSNEVMTPILPIGLPILEKYGGIEKLPIKSNECSNLYLKEIANVLGLKINLTTHVARKTFAMLCLNKYNIPIETVSKVLGHSNIATTQRSYAKVDRGKISNDFGDILREQA